MGLKERQLSGLMIMVLLATVVYGAVYARFWQNPAEVEIPYRSVRSGPVVVELAGDIPQAGIYYLPGKASLAHLMAAAGIKYEDLERPEIYRPLTCGTTVRIGENGRLTLEKMRMPLRLALQLPIDINAATIEEMVMVPGIGEKTARQILALRNSLKSGIRSLDDLKKIGGIKDKRLDKMRRYFYVEEG